MAILHLSSLNDENRSCAAFDQKAAVAKTTRLCFVDDGMECADMRLGGGFKCLRCVRLGWGGGGGDPDFYKPVCVQGRRGNSIFTPGGGPAG